MPAISSIAGKASAFSVIKKRLYPIVSGGILTSDATYYYRTFTSNDTLSIGDKSLNVEYVIVGGGGAGGLTDQYAGTGGGYTIHGQGGAGSSVLTGSSNIGGNYNVVIGQGGYGTEYDFGASALLHNGGTSSIGGVASQIGGLGGKNSGSNDLYASGTSAIVSGTTRSRYAGRTEQVLEVTVKMQLRFNQGRVE